MTQSWLLDSQMAVKKTPQTSLQVIDGLRIIQIAPNLYLMNLRTGFFLDENRFWYVFLQEELKTLVFMDLITPGK